MKDKILAAIRAKYPAVNLSKARLDAIAAVLEPKITDEADIDARIEDYNSFNPLAELAKSDDKVRSLETKVKDLTKKPTGEPAPEATPAAVPDDAPEYVKQMMEMNKKMSDQLAILTGAKVQGEMHSKLTPLLKDIPASFWNERKGFPEKEEDVATFVENTQAAYKTMLKDFADKGLENIPIPTVGAGGGTGGGKPTEISPEIKAFGEKQAAAAAQASAPKATA